MRKHDFGDWVDEELRRRGWTVAELAARGELVPGTLRNILSGGRNAGPVACQGIAKGLQLPEELVFRKAGLLSPKRETEDQRLLKEIMEMAQTLTKAQRREVLHFMSYLSYKDWRPINSDQDGT